MHQARQRCRAQRIPSGLASSATERRLARPQLGGPKAPHPSRRTLGGTTEGDGVAGLDLMNAFVRELDGVADVGGDRSPRAPVPDICVRNRRTVEDRGVLAGVHLRDLDDIRNRDYAGPRPSGLGDGGGRGAQSEGGEGSDNEIAFHLNSPTSMFAPFFGCTRR